MASAKTVYGEISMQADTSPAHQPVPTNPSKEGFIRGLLSAMSPFGAKGRQPMPYVTVNMKSPYDRTERHRELLAMLAMRMRWNSAIEYKYAIDHPFMDIMVSEKGDGTVIVLVVNNDGYVVIEDDGGMYPSDKLVTKLRVLTP